MMAQDFQDLTGQVIKKIIEVTQNMEQQLVSLLIENAPPSVKIDSGLLNGPVINGQGRSDVVTSQKQVDDLLDSLGFYSRDNLASDEHRWLMNLFVF